MATFTISPSYSGIVGFNPYINTTTQVYKQAHSYNQQSQIANQAVLLNTNDPNNYDLSVSNDWEPFAYSLQEFPTFDWSDFRTYLFFDLTSTINSVPVGEEISSINLTFTSTDSVSGNMFAFKSTAFGGNLSNPLDAGPLVIGDFNQADFSRKYSDIITPLVHNSIEEYSIPLTDFAVTQALGSSYLNMALVSELEANFVAGIEDSDGARINFGINWGIGVNLEIITTPVPQNVFKGEIFHAHFYNKALSLSEIEQNYNTIKHRFL